MNIDLTTRLAIADAVTEFQHRLDCALPLDDLLTEDAVVAGSFGEVRGRATISAFFADRARAVPRTIRHCWSNMRLAPDGNEAVVARYVATAFHGDPAAPGSILSASLGDAVDRFVRGGDGWTLAHSRYDAVFRAPTIPAA